MEYFFQLFLFLKQKNPIKGSHKKIRRLRLQLKGETPPEKGGPEYDTELHLIERLQLCWATFFFFTFCKGHEVLT